MTEENPFNKIRINKIVIDHDIFHPLMHRPFTKECREYAGGSRNHIKLWWEYRGQQRLASLTLCKIGHHPETKWWRRDDPVPEIRCRNCYKWLDKDDEGETE